MTTAGKRHIAEFGVGQYGRVERAVAAIEAEAVAAERERIVAEVTALPTLVLPTGTYVDVEDVFDVIGN